MVIRASSASEIRALVAALGLNDEVAREAAAARLAVIGPRVVPHLLAAYQQAQNRTARLAILRAMEPVADPRTLPVSTGAIRDGADLALAAIAVLRQLTVSSHAATADEALEALVSAAIDKSIERRVRLAAIDAVGDLSDGVRGRLQAALSQDPDRWIRARVSAAGSGSIDADAYPIWWLPDLALGGDVEVEIRAGRFISLRDLIEDTGPDISRHVNLYYIEYWSLSHFLFHYRDGSYAERYRRLIAAGGSLRDFERIIGPVDRVQAEWYGYLRARIDEARGARAEPIASPSRQSGQTTAAGALAIVDAPRRQPADRTCALYPRPSS